MFKNGFIIKYGAINLIANDIKFKEYLGRSTVNTDWILLDENEKNIYCMNSFILQSYAPSELTKEIIEKNYNIINLNSMIKEKLKQIEEQELNKLIENTNVYDDFLTTQKNRCYDSSNELVKITEYPYLEYVSHYGTDIKKDDLISRNYTLSFDNLSSGIIDVCFSYKDNTLKFNLFTGDFENTPEEILKEIHSEIELNLIVGYELFKKGLMPDFYNEIVKINDFLQDKVTVTVVLKNGVTYKTNADLHNIFSFEREGKIYINSNYNSVAINGLLPKYKEYSVDQIDKLKYRNNELNINGEYLNFFNLINKDITIFNNVKFEDDIYYENGKLNVYIPSDTLSYNFETISTRLRNDDDRCNIYLDYSNNPNETKLIFDYMIDNRNFQYTYKPDKKEYEVLKEKINDYSLKLYNKTADELLQENSRDNEEELENEI